MIEGRTRLLLGACWSDRRRDATSDQQTEDKGACDDFAGSQYGQPAISSRPPTLHVAHAAAQERAPLFRPAPALARFRFDYWRSQSDAAMPNPKFRRLRILQNIRRAA